MGSKQPGLRARLSVTPQGFQAMISYPDKPTSFIVPIDKNQQIISLIIEVCGSIVSKILNV